MKSNHRYIVACFVCTLVAVFSFAQTSFLNGNVKSLQGGENISAVSVVVKGTRLGGFTDEKGNFKIAGVSKYPVTLIVSSIGYADKEIIATSNPVQVRLEPSFVLAPEVVVSASRLPERILESPVSIERVNAASIRNTPATNYYDIIGTLKGVDMVTSSLNFKTPSTRGFNNSGNLRLNQLVEGMDNQAPGLNFPVGSMVGLTELDVESMELLGGASSALYGPGGMNGTLLINSKDPFRYQGLSVQVKEGVMHIADDARGSSAYNDISLRYGKAVSDKFAFKLGGQYIYAKDWVAQDYRNFDRGTNPAKGVVKPGDRNTATDYNGVNTYGDELPAQLLNTSALFLNSVIQATYPGDPASQAQAQLVLSPYINNNTNVSRTGYREADIIDPTTKNARFSAGVFYKITPGIEASLTGNMGLGTTVYTGSDRYSLKDFKMAQYKLELKHKNWFVRGYTTQEDAGKSFNATATTLLMNEAWKPSYNAANAAGSWYPQYWGAFAQAAGNVFFNVYHQDSAAGVPFAQAVGHAQQVMLANTMAYHAGARAYADLGRPEAGSAEFKRLFDSVAARPIKDGGGKFIDKSSLYMAEGQYNFTDMVKVVELLVGANYKEYVLNSEGTIFADTAGRIKINEVGAYALASKKFFKDILKLTASGRFDKNSNFKGRFTPRFSAVVTVAKDHNIRLSYQTAYRFPSTQNQWINLDVGGGIRLIGGLPQLRDYFNFTNNPVYTPESVMAGTPQKVNFGEYKPESATSYELGYKTLINRRLLIDVYAYYTKYENFIGRQTVFQSSLPDTSLTVGLAFPKVFSVSVNSTEKVNTQGWGLSAEYLLPKNFSVNGNVYMDEIKNVPAGFVTYYNTPKLRTNIGLSNSGMLYKNRVGFALQYRYQDSYYSENDFGSSNVPSFNTFDAQVNYKFPSIHSIIKIGGTNLTNHYYTTAYGNPSIGAIYYASFAYNVF